MGTHTRRATTRHVPCACHTGPARQELGGPLVEKLGDAPRLAPATLAQTGHARKAGSCTSSPQPALAGAPCKTSERAHLGHCGLGLLLLRRLLLLLLLLRARDAHQWLGARGRPLCRQVKLQVCEVAGAWEGALPLEVVPAQETTQDANVKQLEASMHMPMTVSQCTGS